MSEDKTEARTMTSEEYARYVAKYKAAQEIRNATIDTLLKEARALVAAIAKEARA